MCLNDNEFKQVINFESYEVCKCGVVRKRDKTKKVLKQTVNNHYLSVKIYSGIKNKWFRKYVHRLVAERFCSGNFKGAVINHIDGNKMNNHYTNLEFTTQSKNNTHLDRHKKVGEKQRKPIVAFNEKEVLQFESVTKAVENGFNSGGIYWSLKNTKKYKNFYWKFLSDLNTLAVTSSDYD